MIKLNLRNLVVLGLSAVILFSCSGLPVSDSEIDISSNKDEHSLSIDRSISGGIGKISILCRAEGLLVDCIDNISKEDSRIVSVEWRTPDSGPPCLTEFRRLGNRLILEISDLPETAPDREERIVTVRLADNLEVSRFENISASSSTRIRLSNRNIGNLRILTSTGSSYVQLFDCVAGRIHINSDYGRSYLAVENTRIDTGLYLSGNPDEAKVLYYDKTAGAVHADIKNSIVEGAFKISSKTGKIEIYAENSVFRGTIQSNSICGMHFYDLWDCDILTDSPVSAVSDSGKIYFKWAQHEKNGRDIEVNLESESEEVYFRAWGPLDLYRYDIFTDTQSGIREFHSYEDFNELEKGVRYQSKNFSAPLDLLTVRAVSESGKIYTRVVDCYKVLRFCGDFKVMRPLEPPF